MEKYLQDRAWSMLPCKYREEVKRLYEEFKDVSDRYKDVPCLSDADRRSSDRNIGHLAAMRAVFGEHNLTADSDELRKNGYEKLSGKRLKLYKLTAEFQFGKEVNFATKKPKPAEPKNEGTHQEQCVPKNAESGTHSFSHILKDGFREHNRLQIAAMAMQGILANSHQEMVDVKIDKVAELAIETADALIAKCKKKGGSHD